MSYQQKYIKYKQKYLELKNSLQNSKLIGGNNLLKENSDNVIDIHKLIEEKAYPRSGYVDQKMEKNRKEQLYRQIQFKIGKFDSEN